MAITDIARTDVVTVEPGEAVPVLAERMREEGVGSVVVVDGETPVGLVTDRDVALRIWEVPDPRRVVAEDLMTAEPTTVDADTGVYEALRTAREAGVRRLPVLDDGELVGIVTLDDIVVLLVGELEEVSALIQSESPEY